MQSFRVEPWAHKKVLPLKQRKNCPGIWTPNVGMSQEPSFWGWKINAMWKSRIQGFRKDSKCTKIVNQNHLETKDSRNDLQVFWDWRFLSFDIPVGPWFLNTPKHYHRQKGKKCLWHHLWHSVTPRATILWKCIGINALCFDDSNIRAGGGFPNKRQRTRANAKAHKIQLQK